jgi:hypothetical protein
MKHEGRAVVFEDAEDLANASTPTTSMCAPTTSWC